MEIGEKTMNAISDSVDYMLTNYQKEINEAWNMAGDDPLKITIGIKLDVSKFGDTEITTNFTFVKERVKDQSIKNVNEDQAELFEVKTG